MKNMYRLLLLLLIVVVASSCRRDLDSLNVNQAEQRIIGSWAIKKVENKVRFDGKWGRNDVSGNFRDWQFEFNADRTLTLFIPDENLSLVGSWEVYEDWETDNDGDQDLVTFLYMYIYSPDNLGVWREIYWEDMTASPNNFRAREIFFENGKRVTYFYELERQ